VILLENQDHFWVFILQR